MDCIATTLSGAYLLQTPLFRDRRGTFNRLFCQENLQKFGLSDKFVQSNICINENNGIIRGLHYQSEPHQETKIVTCLVGKIYDVIVDVRPNSSTYLQWEGFELSCPNISLYVPRGFAHGYQTLVANSVVHYSIDEFYNPNYEQGLRYDDPKIGIKWQLPMRQISDKDQSWPLLD